MPTGPVQVTIGDAVPRRGGAFTRAFGRLGLAVAGWRLVGEIPDAPKFVAIVAPHTSNWDFVVGLLAKFALAVDAAWLGKHTLFRPPFGAIMRRWGGIPVDRAASHDVVAQTVAAFAARPRMVLAVAPEGTRKRVTAWRSGFYHIARGAGVPILLVALDWPHRTIRFGPTVTPTGDAEGDIARIRARYADVAGKRPRDR